MSVWYTSVVRFGKRHFQCSPTRYSNHPNPQPSCFHQLKFVIAFRAYLQFNGTHAVAAFRLLGSCNALQTLEMRVCGRTMLGGKQPREDLMMAGGAVALRKRRRMKSLAAEVMESVPLCCMVVDLGYLGHSTLPFQYHQPDFTLTQMIFKPLQESRRRR